MPRCSMSGLVSTQSACARTQSRSSSGVSPSKVAARTSGRTSARSDAQLVGGQRLGRRQVQRGGPRVGRASVDERGQLVGQRLARGGAGRDHHRRPAWASSAAVAWCAHGARDAARPEARRPAASGAHSGQSARRPARAATVLDVGHRVVPGGRPARRSSRSRPRSGGDLRPSVRTTSRPTLARRFGQIGRASRCGCLRSADRRASSACADLRGGAPWTSPLSTRDEAGHTVVAVCGEVDVYTAPAAARPAHRPARRRPAPAGHRPRRGRVPRLHRPRRPGRRAQPGPRAPAAACRWSAPRSGC